MEATETKDGETKPDSKQPQDASKEQPSLLSDVNVLYPAFWTMQQAFSNPPDYFFKQERMEEFKKTLEATLAKFREVPKVNQAAADLRGVKRSAGDLDGQDEFGYTVDGNRC